VILDIFSRRVVGRHVADAETTALFAPLIDETIEDHAVPPGQLALHADRGDTKSHSRPYTSNDNPFSESGFNTLKYQPHFPQRFGCMEDA
jgi:putative transposase